MDVGPYLSGVVYLCLICDSSCTGTNRTRMIPAESTERQLVNEVLQSYQKLGAIVRPVSNTSQPVLVQYGLGIIQMDLMEKENIMFMSAWTKYLWRDEYLQWNPADYDGIESIKLPSDRIWNPDIMLYNTASTTTYTRRALAVVSWSGDVKWFPHRVFESTCSVNVRYFPFDSQACHMYFGSWTHTVKEINLSLVSPTSIDLSTLDMEHNDSSMWQIHDAEASIVHPDPDYVLLSFTLKLKRKMMFTSYILTVPAVFLSFLTLVVFSLPSEDVEKSHLGLAIFGSLLLLLLIVVEAAPPTAKAVPLLGIFYCFTTVIVILSVFLTALVVKVGNAGSVGRKRPLPRILKLLVIKGLGTILCVHHHDNTTESAKRYSEHVEADDFANGYPGAEMNCRPTQPLTTHRRDSTGPDVTHHSDELRQQIQGILTTLCGVSKFLHERQTRDEVDRDFEREWRAVAAIMDRLFFWLYFIAIIISLIFLFPWSGVEGWWK